MRWGIIGCGDVARKRVAEAIRADREGELVAACRRHREPLDAFCRAFDVSSGYTDAYELLADSRVEAVYISTPVSTHCEFTRAAAEAGKHVLVEKPMAMTVEECDQMIGACQIHQVGLGVAYYRPFYPVVARIKELIETGQLGRIYSVSALTAIPFDFPRGEDGYWRVVPEVGGGGVLMDIGSHRLDLFQHLFGPIVRVQAICGTVAADYQSENAATLAMQFASGTHGSLQCFFGCKVDPDEFRVLGTSGTALAAPLNGGRLKIETEAGVTEELHPPSQNFNAPLIRDFTAAVAAGQAPLVDGPRGREINRVLAAAYASSTP